MNRRYLILVTATIVETVSTVLLTLSMMAGWLNESTRWVSAKLNRTSQKMLIKAKTAQPGPGKSDSKIAQTAVEGIDGLPAVCTGYLPEEVRRILQLKNMPCDKELEQILHKILIDIQKAKPLLN